MSGKFRRSTQHGKKISLPTNIPFLNNESDQLLKPENQNLTTNASLSPYLGHLVTLDESTYLNETLNKNDTKKSELNINHCDSTFSTLSDIESWDTGSTSSISWFDEFDHESMEKLNKELEDIEQVLYGENDISILRSELQRECQEWIDAFPHLRITGMNIHQKKKKNLGKYNTSHKCDNFFQDGKSFSIISNIVNISQQNKSSKSEKNFFNRENIKQLPFKNDIVETESFLRISPIPFLDSSYKSKPSPASSLIRSEVSSSKWRQQLSPEFSSLPYIPANNNNTKNKNNVFIENVKTSFINIDLSQTPRSNLKPLRTVPVKPKHKSAKSGRSDTYYQTLTRTKPVILPPIDQLNISNDNSYFRSISATPAKSTLLYGLNSERNLHRAGISNTQRNKMMVNNVKKDSLKIKPKSNYH